MNIDKQLDQARNAQMNNYLESIFDAEKFLYKCLECKESKPRVEMKVTDKPELDVGCCNECAANQDIADLWGFDNGDD